MWRRRTGSRGGPSLHVADKAAAMMMLGAVKQLVIDNLNMK